MIGHETTETEIMADRVGNCNDILIAPLFFIVALFEISIKWTEELRAYLVLFLLIAAILIGMFGGWRFARREPKK